MRLSWQAEVPEEDPGVITATARRAYAEAGRGLADDVWLEWMGRGNGYPSPAPDTQHQD